MSRADSSLQAGPSSSKKRSASSDSENRNVPTSKVLKKVKTEELKQPRGSSSDLLKKKRKRRRRKSSITEVLKPVGILAMRSMVKPSSAKSVASTSTKGKERVIEPEKSADETKAGSSSQLSELQLLREKVEKQQKILDAHSEFTSSITASLTCQICLDPMLRPYALAPCGHTSCYTCLVAWFRAAPPHISVPPPALLAQNFDRDDPTMLALGAPMLVRKDKTCPHCRAVVREAPVEAWAIKDIVTAAFSNKGGIAGSLFPGHDHSPSVVPDASNGDPWQGIFKSGRVRWGWNGNGNAQNNAGAFADEEVEELRTRGFYDEEDNAYRCTSCFHEIWDGVCSHCGRLYRGHDADAHDSEDSDSFAGDPDYDDEEGLDWLDHHDLMEGAMDAYWNARAFDEMLEHGGFRREEDDADNGYESSFIDDDENHPVTQIDDFDSVAGDYHEGSDGEEDGYGEILEPPRLARREAPPVVIRPGSRHISFSDDEESQFGSDEDVYVARVLTAGRRRVLSDDEDEDEDEDEEDSEEDIRRPGTHANNVTGLQRLVSGWGRRAAVLSDEDEDENDDDSD